MKRTAGAVTFGITFGRLSPGTPEPEGDQGQGGRAGFVSPIGAEKSTWHPEYVDVREDRVVLFGTASTAAQEFVYNIKATNQGTYSVPPVFAESMYDRGVQARGLGAQFIVQKP